MHLNWRGRVARHILTSNTPLQNFYDPIYGHIGHKILKNYLEESLKKPDVTLYTALEKMGERLGLDRYGYTPAPVNGLEDVIISIDRETPKGSTAYILPWYHLEEEVYRTLYRPYFKIPIEGVKPRRGILQYNYEYNGIYHLRVPDRYTGEIYIDLLKEYIETILEVGGYLIIDITYLHTHENYDDMKARIVSLVEPISKHTLFYLDLSRAYIDPKFNLSVAYGPGPLIDITINHRGVNQIALMDEKPSIELFTIDLIWNEFIKNVKDILKGKRDILKSIGIQVNLESSYTTTISCDNPLEYAEKLLNENLIVEPIEQPKKGLTLDLYTDTEVNAIKALATHLKER